MLALFVPRSFFSHLFYSRTDVFISLLPDLCSTMDFLFFLFKSHISIKISFILLIPINFHLGNSFGLFNTSWSGVEFCISLSGTYSHFYFGLQEH